MRNHLDDPFVKLAQKEGYRARAVYKLSEIDEGAKLIKPGQIIVDLGCAPGSWSQYIARKLGNQEANQVNGTIIGLDILPMEPIEGVHFLQGDFCEESMLQELEGLLKGRKADLVLSDMAPNLSGIASADAARVEYLMDLALEFAQAHLKPSGSLLVKCFNGSTYNEILKKFRQTFLTVTPVKPKASRNYSSEIFLLGRQLRHPES